MLDRQVESVKRIQASSTQVQQSLATGKLAIDKATAETTELQERLVTLQVKDSQTVDLVADIQLQLAHAKMDTMAAQLANGKIRAESEQTVADLTIANDRLVMVEQQVEALEKKEAQDKAKADEFDRLHRWFGLYGIAYFARYFFIWLIGILAAASLALFALSFVSPALASVWAALVAFVLKFLGKLMFWKKT